MGPVVMRKDLTVKNFSTALHWFIYRAKITVGANGVVRAARGEVVPAKKIDSIHPGSHTIQFWIRLSVLTIESAIH